MASSLNKIHVTVITELHDTPLLTCIRVKFEIIDETIAGDMKGLLRIRLARFGRKHQPVYNIVVAHHKKAANKLPIEVLGTYSSEATPLSPQDAKADALPVKDVHLDFLRAQYWLGTGAQPTPTVARLFKKAGLLPPGWPGPREGTLKAPEREVKRSQEAASEPVPPPVR